MISSAIPGVQTASASGPRLGRKSHGGRACLSVAGQMTLALGRVHELCGRARRTLAMAIAAAGAAGPVIWIAPGWTQERLNGEGVTEWIDPGRLLLVYPDRAEDVLWTMEESLRAGVAPLVVAEITEPLALKPVRRLHLAAETGGTNGPVLPTGLLLTPAEGHAAGVESRWQLSPNHDARDAMSWRLARLRDRTAPPAAWPLHATRGADRRWRLQPQTAHATG